MSEKLYKCPECSEINSGDKWNEKTIAYCGTKNITSIEEKGSVAFHVCPNCGQCIFESMEEINCESEDKYEHCKVCNSDSEFVKLDDEISATICDKILVVSQYSPLFMESDVVEIEVNYCPMCGRKL